LNTRPRFGFAQLAHEPVAFLVDIVDATNRTDCVRIVAFEIRLGKPQSTRHMRPATIPSVVGHTFKCTTLVRAECTRQFVDVATGARVAQPIALRNDSDAVTHLVHGQVAFTAKHDLVAVVH
jgi:hypothetical protein